MAQLTVQEQKIQIRRLMNKKRSKGDMWYLVATSWFHKWAEFVGFDLHWDEDNDSWDTSNVGNPSAYPGPIDNSGLMTDSGELKKYLIGEFDYQLIPTEGWELFLLCYGIIEGQEPIARKVIEDGMFVKHYKVEVYLTDLKLCMPGNEDNFIKIRVSFSRADTIKYIEETMRKFFKIGSGKESRLWSKSMTNTYALLDKPEYTIADVGLYFEQLIVIEIRNDDGTWPRSSHQHHQNQTERQQVSNPKVSNAIPAAVNSDKQLCHQSRSDHNTFMEQMITCVICFEVMVKPHMLPCMHSFCEACLKKLHKVEETREQGFHCPTCREFATERDMRKDFRIEEMIQIHRSNISAKKLKLSESNMCKKHPLFVVKAICTQCNVEICSECKFQDHDTHPSQTLASAVDNLLPTVSNKIEILAKKVGEMNSSLQAVEDKKHKIRCTKEAALLDIQKQIEIVQKKLDAEFANLTSDVSNLYESVENDLDAKENLIKQSIEQVQSFITDVNNAMADSKDVELYRSLQDSLVKCDEMLKKNDHKEFNTSSDDEIPNVHFERVDSNSPLLGNVTDASN